MEARYYYAMNSKHFLLYLQNLPQSTIEKWRNKYGICSPEVIAESPTKQDSQIIRVSSSSYIWR